MNDLFKLNIDFDNMELRDMLKHLQDNNLLEEFHLLRVTLNERLNQFEEAFSLIMRRPEEFDLFKWIQDKIKLLK